MYFIEKLISLSKMKKTFLILLLFSLCFYSCTQSSEVSFENIDKKCAKETRQCEKDCRHGDFRWCYIDPKYISRPPTVRKNCYGTHVGRTCPPCKNIYVLNFGGSMRKVSCKEFYKSLQKKNRQCGDCLQKVENVG